MFAKTLLLVQIIVATERDVLCSTNLDIPGHGGSDTRSVVGSRVNDSKIEELLFDKIDLELNDIGNRIHEKFAEKMNDVFNDTITKLDEAENRFDDKFRNKIDQVLQEIENRLNPRLAKKIQDFADKAIDGLDNAENLIHHRLLEKLDKVLANTTNILVQEWSNHFTTEIRKSGGIFENSFKYINDKIQIILEEILNKTSKDMLIKFSLNFNDALDNVLDTTRENISNIGESVHEIFEKNMTKIAKDTTTEALNRLGTDLTERFETLLKEQLSSVNVSIVSDMSNILGSVNETALGMLSSTFENSNIEHRLQKIENYVTYNGFVEEERATTWFTFDSSRNCTTVCNRQRILMNESEPICNEEITKKFNNSDNDSIINEATIIGTYNNGSMYCDFISASRNCSGDESINDVTSCRNVDRFEAKPTTIAANSQESLWTYLLVGCGIFQAVVASVFLVITSYNYIKKFRTANDSKNRTKKRVLLNRNVQNKRFTSLY